jgi:hypothetical protein
VFAIALTLVIVTTLSRSVLTSLLVYVVLLYILLQTKKNPIKILLNSLVIVILLSVVLQLPQVSSRIENSILILESVATDNVDLIGYSHRVILLNATFSIVAEHPLTGVGFSELQQTLWTYGSTKMGTEKLIQVHGEIFYILIVGGITLGLLFMLVMIYLFNYSWKLNVKRVIGGSRINVNHFLCAYFIAIIPLLFANTFGKLILLQLQLGIVALVLLSVVQARSER